MVSSLTLQVYDIPCKVNFTLVRPLMRLDVVNIAMGASHSAVIDGNSLFIINVIK